MQQEATMDMTQMAMGDRNNRSRDGDELLYAKFYNNAIEDSAETKKQGRPIYKDVAFLTIQAPGNKESKINRPVRQGDAERFPKQWAAFNNDEEQVQQGTPLEVWPVITRAQVEELRYFNVYTVEQLAGMPLSNLQNFRGGINLQERAKLFLEVAKGTAPVEELKAANDELRNSNETLQRQVSDLAARLDELTESQPKKRGRPRKTE